LDSDRKIYCALFVLLALSAVLRGFLAGFIELGNDEVYYLTYARFPDLSHFDHPPMVGLAIRFFTLNLLFENEFFIRLASVVFGTLSTGLIFLIGRRVKDPITGLYAAMLYTASFYGFILSGTFILPDAPQVFFWLLAIFFLLKSLPSREITSRDGWFLLLAGVSSGLALLSKYHSVFLILGVAVFVLLYNRKWFGRWELYGFFLLIVLISLPVVVWNIGNNFISFTYHERRISVTASGIQPKYFLTEMIGEFFYNNPVNVVIILVALFAIMFRKKFMPLGEERFLLWTSIPLVLVFQSFSLFRSTLPHWTGPGYLGLIVVAAAYLAERGKKRNHQVLVPWPAGLSLALLLFVTVMAAGQIRYGWIPSKGMKTHDPTVDLSGWRQLGEKFDRLATREERRKLIRESAPILTFRWFPAANFDYYLERKVKNPVYALGTLERIHKYFWIDQFRGNLPKGSDAWYIALSDDYGNPVALYGELFTSIVASDTLYLTRGSDTIRKAFVFRMKGLKKDLKFGGKP